ncbi:peptide ABC transporter substrate-binding protein [Spirochaetia bacterium]|nr:peptide ABC transporter substrate-binding protein [Spirochaetia bacterium]
MKKIVTLSAVLLALAFTACGNSGSTTKPAGTQQRIVFSLQSVPDGLDPGVTNNSFASPLLFNLFEGLITYDRNNNIVPGLAESWTISPDGTVYTFKLRPNLKWSDGSTLDANDFVYSYLRILDPKTLAQNANMFTDYIVGAEAFYEGTGPKENVGIRAPDPNTLEITLKEPTSFYLGILGTWAYFPVQQATVEKSPDRWTLSASTYISNGPFKVTDIKLDESVTVAKNENYWNAANVKLEEIVFRYILEPTTALTALEAGQVDGVRTPPTAELSRLRSGPFFQGADTFAITYYLINHKVKPFDDVRVRRAFAMAIDRQAIIANILQSSDAPAYGLVPPGYVVNGVDFTDNRPTYGLGPTANVEGARQLLAEAGYPNGEGFPTVKLSFYSDRMVGAIVEALQQMWKQNLNVNAEVSSQEWAVYFDGILAEDFQIAAMGGSGDYLHPTSFLSMYTSNNILNFHTYKDPRYDALIKQALTESDPVKAVTIMQEAEDLAMNDVADIPIYSRSSVFLMAPHVKGYVMTPLSNLYFRDAYVER